MCATEVYITIEDIQWGEDNIKFTYISLLCLTEIHYF